MSRLVGGGVVLPDIATCNSCLDDVFDPTNRRFLYPFTNCTDCGPRYSILMSLPYDRVRTTMSEFSMCEDCAREYGDVHDRRFHAEPIACASCGPQIALLDGAENLLEEKGAAIERSVALIEEGKIVAIKGLGGFHLFADARDSSVVRRLRERKRRPTKPFALMVPSLAVAHQLSHIGEAEEVLLRSTAAPIVLLRKKTLLPVAEEVAPGQSNFGLMLPYTPLHHILMRRLGFPLIATSGNLSDEPIVTTEQDAFLRLGSVADFFVVHDRPIAKPAEDSIVRVICGAPQAIRRGRGFAPLSLALEKGFVGHGPAVLALGGHLKATATLLQDDGAIVGPHVGDLGTLDAEMVFGEAVEHIEMLQDVRADVVACDLHPDYASTRIGEGMGRTLVRVPHHLAHIVSVMAEHGLEGPVLGVAWDGAGYGPDGTIWGGEFLDVERGRWSRRAHLRSFSLPGSAAAFREPRRAALGALYEVFGESAAERIDLPSAAAFPQSERDILWRMLKRGVQSPRTTSAGRLFDAFAALVGLTPIASYEGEAAMHLEMLAEGQTGDPYLFGVIPSESGPSIIDWGPMLRSVVQDRADGISTGQIAWRIHATFAAMILAVVSENEARNVVLGGGCFQNRLLTEHVVREIESIGRKVFLARFVPPNDGGLSLGQALWARWICVKE